MFFTSSITKDKAYEELDEIYDSRDPKHVLITHDDIKNINLLEQPIEETFMFFFCSSSHRSEINVKLNGYTSPYETIIFIFSYYS